MGTLIGQYLHGLNIYVGKMFSYIFIPSFGNSSELKVLKWKHKYLIHCLENS